MLTAVKSSMFKLFAPLSRKIGVLKKIILFFYTLSSCWAYGAPVKPARDSGPILLTPTSMSPTKRFILSYQGYQDIRVDSNHDGKVDLWILKKDNLQISTRYAKNGILSYISLKKISDKNILEAVYVPSSDKKMKLIASGKRSARLMHGSIENNCVTAKQDVLKKFEQFSAQISRRGISGAVDELFDSSCSPDSPTYLKSSAALVEITAASQEKNSFVDCLEGDKFKKDFSEDQSLAVDLVTAQLRLNLARIAHGDNKPKINIRCESSASMSDISGTYVEGGDFLIKAPTNSGEIKPATFEKLFLHEFLHQAGSPSEQFISKALDACYEKEARAITLASGTSNGSGAIQKNAEIASRSIASTNEDKLDLASAQISVAPVSLEDVKKSINNGHISADVDMSREIALSQPLPSASQLAVAAVDKSSEGLNSTLEASTSQSAPVFRMANQMMGSMNAPAVASGSSLADSSNTTDSKSNKQTRTIASESAPRLDIVRGDKVAANEKVVEQIEVGGSSSSTSDVANAPAKPVSPTAAAESNSNELGSRVPASVGTASRGAAGAQASGSLLNDPGGSAQPAAPVSNPTRGGSSASAPAARNPASSRDEVVTFFSQGDYSMTKGKLKEPKFVNKLQENKITIIDLYGNSYGAARGDVIFLDEGNRFVRQK